MNKNISKSAEDTFVALVINDIDHVSGYSILKTRLDNEFWGLHKSTQCKKLFRSGTKIIFYVAGKKVNSKCFVASAECAEDLIHFPKSDIDAYGGGEHIYINYPTEKVILENINWFSSPVDIYKIMNKMDKFHHSRPQKWGIYIQGGAFSLTKEDYNLIMKKSNK